MRGAARVAARFGRVVGSAGRRTSSRRDRGVAWSAPRRRAATRSSGGPVPRESLAAQGTLEGSVRVSAWGARATPRLHATLAWDVGSPDDAESRLAGEVWREEVESEGGERASAEGQARVGTDSRRRRCRRRRAFRPSAGIPATRSHLLGFDAAKVDKLPLLNASHRLATLSQFAPTHQHPRSHGLQPSAAPSGWTARTTSPSSTARRRRRPRPFTKTHPRVVASRCSTRAGSPSRRRGACTSPTPATTASASSTATACACSPGRARAATPTARASRRRSRTRAGWCSTRTACSSWPTAATTASGGSRRRAW